MSDSISNLVRRIRNYNAKKADEVLPASAIQFDGETFMLNDKPIMVTATALRQLCWFAKIPADFFITRLDEAEQVPIFNRLYLGMKDTEVMFRLSGNTLYGIVTPSYRPLDNILIIDLIKEIAATGVNLQAVSSVLDPDFTKIRLIKKNGQPGELMPMLEFTNSENGLSSLRVWAGVFRLACSNGMLVPVHDVRCRWMHFGSQKIKMPEVAGLINTSLNYTRLLDSSRSIYLSASGKALLLESMAQHLPMNVTESLVEMINREYDGGRTMFDVINAITQTAQSFSPLKQTEIEEYAGTILAREVTRH